MRHILNDNNSSQSDTPLLIPVDSTGNYILFNTESSQKTRDWARAEQLVADYTAVRPDSDY